MFFNPTTRNRLLGFALSYYPVQPFKFTILSSNFGATRNEIANIYLAQLTSLSWSMEESSSRLTKSIVCISITAFFVFATAALHIAVAVEKQFAEAAVVTLGTFLSTYLLLGMWLIMYYFQKTLWVQLKFICLLAICSHILSTFLASVMANIEHKHIVLLLVLCVMSWISLFVLFFTVAFGLNHALPYTSESEPIAQVWLS